MDDFGKVNIQKVELSPIVGNDELVKRGLPIVKKAEMTTDYKTGVSRADFQLEGHEVSFSWGYRKGDNEILLREVKCKVQEGAKTDYVMKTDPQSTVFLGRAEGISDADIEYSWSVGGADDTGKHLPDNISLKRSGTELIGPKGMYVGTRAATAVEDSLTMVENIFASGGLSQEHNTMLDVFQEVMIKTSAELQQREAV